MVPVAEILRSIIPVHRRKGGGGAGQSGRSEGTTERTELLAVTLLLGRWVLGGGKGGGSYVFRTHHLKQR